MKKRNIIRISVQILFFVLFTIIMLNGKMVLWLALYAFSVASSFIFGRYFCSYVCPMNSAMGLSNKLKKKDTTKKVINLKLADFIPFLSLIATVLIMAITKKQFKLNIPLLLIYVPLSFLYALLFSSSLWHNYLCPYSILLKLGGSHSLYQYRVDESSCIGCKKCLKACKVGAMSFNSETKKAIINPTLCHVCGDCADVCNVRAISYSKK